MSCIKANQGLVLIVLLFTVAVISVLGATIVSASLRENMIAYYQEDYVSAQYIAECGLQKALVSLEEHPDWESDDYWNDLLGREIEFEDGSYKLEFSKKGSYEPGNELEVVSAGKYRSAVCVIKADVKITKVHTKIYDNLVSINSETAITYSGNADIHGDMYCNTDMTLNGNAYVSGNVTNLGKSTLGGNSEIGGDLYSEGDIELFGNATIRGNVKSRGNLTLKGNSKIKGTIQVNGVVTPEGKYDFIHGGVEAREPMVFPKLDELLDTYLQEAQKEGKYYSYGNIPSKISGTTFVDSNVSISGNKDITGHGVLVINGNLDMSGNIDIISEDGGAVVIIVNGDVIIRGQKSLKCVFFTAGNFDVKGNTDIYGCIVSKNITGSGNLDIWPLANLENRLPDNAPGIALGEFETKVELVALTYENE
ncbi:MAG: hypothetical protein WBI37_09020 [Tepidanaerobacteraceae bacterium]